MKAQTAVWNIFLYGDFAMLIRQVIQPGDTGFDVFEQFIFGLVLENKIDEKWFHIWKRQLEKEQIPVFVEVALPSDVSYTTGSGKIIN